MDGYTCDNFSTLLGESVLDTLVKVHRSFETNDAAGTSYDGIRVIVVNQEREESNRQSRIIRISKCRFLGIDFHMGRTKNVLTISL